jgi:integrase
MAEWGTPLPQNLQWVKGSPFIWYEFWVRGDRFRGSCKTDNIKRAKDRLAVERNKAITGDYRKEAQTLTLTEAFAKYWLERAQFNVSSPSIKAHITHIMGYFGERKPLQDIGAGQLAEYVAQCRGESYTRPDWKKPKKTSPAIINRRLATFQGMHGDARLKWEIQVKNIDFSELKLKEPPPINNIMPDDKLEKWLKLAPEHVRHFTMFAVFSSLRSNNIITLEGSQIDAERQTIATVGKGGKKLVTPIVDPLMRYIRAYGLHKFRGRVITYQGKPIKSVKTACNTLARKLKMKGFRRHDMRHTCLTWIYEHTGDLLLTKEIAGHSDIRTTMRYVHTKKDAQQKKASKALSPKISAASLKRVK